MDWKRISVDGALAIGADCARFTASAVSNDRSGADPMATMIYDGYVRVILVEVFSRQAHSLSESLSTLVWKQF